MMDAVYTNSIYQLALKDVAVTDQKKSQQIQRLEATGAEQNREVERRNEELEVEKGRVAALTRRCEEMEEDRRRAALEQTNLVLGQRNLQIILEGERKNVRDLETRLTETEACAADWKMQLASSRNELATDKERTVGLVQSLEKAGVLVTKVMGEIKDHAEQKLAMEREVSHYKGEVQRLQQEAEEETKDMKRHCHIQRERAGVLHHELHKIFMILEKFVESHKKGANDRQIREWLDEIQMVLKT
ncbi:hypothetical protein HK104_009898 [Borealophlyctis nickersoniae]|nr:hypothetical protein HK104_009898 [Borealophlyctis nickersoniae]